LFFASGVKSREATGAFQASPIALLTRILFFDKEIDNQGLLDQAY